MNTRSSAHYQRTHASQRSSSSWLGAAMAIAFAAAPLVAMLWVVPVTGIGIA